jgi:hypothetical protein
MKLIQIKLNPFSKGPWGMEFWNMPGEDSTLDLGPWGLDSEFSSSEVLQCISGEHRHVEFNIARTVAPSNSLVALVYHFLWNFIETSRDSLQEF